MGQMKQAATAKAEVEKNTGIQAQDAQVQALTPAHNYKLTDFLGSDMYTPAKIELIRRTVAKGCSDLELAYFLSIAQGVGLNPLVKEIWCYKDNKGNQIMFAGRDGFKRIAQKDEAFVSLNSMEVREGDTFSITTEMGQTIVNHSFSPADADRHKKTILGAYAILRSKRAGEVSEIVEWADMGRYNKQWNAWGTHPEEMIKKVAEVHAMKKFTNISALYSEAEFEFKQNKQGETIVQTGPDLIEAGKDRKAALRKKTKKGKRKSKK